MSNSENPRNKYQGVVKWYSPAKGYGFIVSTDRPHDIFFHINEYRSEAILKVGDRVRFDLGPGRKDKEVAKNVEFMGRGDGPPSHKRFFGKATYVKTGIFGFGLRKLTSTCMKCGGTGHVTAIEDAIIGFQCIKCKAFWRKRDSDISGRRTYQSKVHLFRVTGDETNVAQFLTVIRGYVSDDRWVTDVEQSSKNMVPLTNRCTEKRLNS